MVKRLSLILGVALVFAATAAFAGGEGMAEGGGMGMAATTGYPPWLAALAIASGFGIALAAFGGALAQGRAASSALEGLARNPGAGGRIQTLLILGLALIESLVIYALVITYLLQDKIPPLTKEALEKMIGK